MVMLKTLFLPVCLCRKALNCDPFFVTLSVVSLVRVNLWHAQQALIPLCQLFACGACLLGTIVMVRRV